MPRLVFGADPGLHLGWCVLRDNEFVVGGELEAPLVDSSLCDRISSALARCDIDLVAVEYAKGKAHGEDDPKKAAAKSKHLVHANDVAGLVTGIAFGRGLPFVRFPAAEWRSRIVGKPYPSDAEIARVLKLRVRKLPRCSAHVRDAVGVALYASLEHELMGLRR